MCGSFKFIKVANYIYLLHYPSISYIFSGMVLKYYQCIDLSVDIAYPEKSEVLSFGLH